MSLLDQSNLWGLMKELRNLIDVSWSTAGLWGVGLSSVVTLSAKYLSTTVPPATFYLYLFGICWLTLVLLSKCRFPTPRLYEWILIFAAGACSYVGNLAEMKALVASPQVGYVVAVKMSQVIFVTVAGTMLFQDTRLSGLGIIGIAVLVSGNVLISIDSGEGFNSEKPEWVFFAILSAGAFSTMILVAKGLSRTMNSPEILLFLLPVGFLGYLSTVLYHGESLLVTWEALGILVLTGFAAALGNILAFDAINRAPHPGYGSALSSTQIAVVTPLAVILFPGQLVSSLGILGMSLSLAGVILICLIGSRVNPPQ